MSSLDRYFAKLRIELEKIFTSKNTKGVTIIPQKLLDSGDLYSVPSLNTFAIAFTTKSFSYNPEENNDLYEFAGDPLVNKFVADVVMEKFPTMPARGKSNMLSFYKSNYVFGNILKQEFGEEKLRTDLIRTGPYYKHDEKVYADVFEAFIYSVSVVCDAISGVKIGTECARNVFLYMTRHFKYDERKHSQGSSKTLVTELLKKENKDAEQTFYEMPSDKKKEVFKGKLSVVLTSAGAKRAKQIHDIVKMFKEVLRFQLPEDNTFTAGYIPKPGELAPNKKLITMELYDQVLEWLLPGDITVTEFHKYEAMYLIRNDPNYNYGEIMNKLNEQNISISFEKEKTSTGQYIWYLIGTNNETKRGMVLASELSGASAQDFPEIRKRLIMSYINTA